MSNKSASSIPGMIYPSGRDHFLQTCFAYLEGRRKDDGAEGLWRIHDNLYDLNGFIKNHPGGSEWISITKGTDITEAFEAHHITDKAERLLPKFYVRQAVSPRSLPYTFNEDGFYKIFKARAHTALVMSGIDFHNPSFRSKVIADITMTIAILSAISAGIFKWWSLIIISAIFLHWTASISHNFLHMKDNFRRFYLDLSMMSSRDWRVSHALSHHLYPNTLWDIEVYAFEPFNMQYLVKRDKSFLKILSLIVTLPLVYCIGFIAQGVKRYYSILVEWKNPDFREFIPFLLPLVMSIFTPTILQAFKIWFYILTISSIIFVFIGLSLAHHHPDIFHDGDICRKELDWGLMTLDAVRDREVIDDSIFLVLTTFGLHALHHLLPTVDHDYLKYCLPAFHKTCLEFGVDAKKLSQWELVKGQYKQLIRTEPRANYYQKRQNKFFTEE